MEATTIAFDGPSGQVNIASRPYTQELYREPFARIIRERFSGEELCSGKLNPVTILRGFDVPFEHCCLRAGVLLGTRIIALGVWLRFWWVAYENCYLPGQEPLRMPHISKCDLYALGAA